MFYERRCDVMRPHRRSPDVVLTLCVCCVTGIVNSQEIDFRNKVFEPARTILAFMTVEQQKHKCAD